MKMKMKFIPILILLTGFISCKSDIKDKGESTSSIKILKITSEHKFCSYSSGQSIEKIYSFNSESSVNKEAQLILKNSGLPSNFKILSADVPNAAALIYSVDDGPFERYILYNPEFMKNVTDKSNNKWAQISILAHEIGHHLAGHTLVSESRKIMELEADKYSGFILRTLGSTSDDAIAAMETIGSNLDSETHPKKSTRIAAILTGWNEAEAMKTKNKKEVEIKNTPIKQEEDFYIINISAIKEKKDAITEKNKLIAKGYKAGYLWIPDYPTSLSSNEYYSVYIGPFNSQYECEVAVENYRISFPESYGLRISENKPRLRIEGIDKVKKHK
jgi:hypothetical protein